MFNFVSSHGIVIIHEEIDCSVFAKIGLIWVAVTILIVIANVDIY